MGLREIVQKEIQTSTGFKLACIGGVFFVIAGLIRIFATGKPIWLGILDLLFICAYIMLSLYTTYCYVHGQCNTYATASGVLVLITAILMVATSSAMFWAARGRKKGVYYYQEHGSNRSGRRLM